MYSLGINTSFPPGVYFFIGEGIMCSFILSRSTSQISALQAVMYTWNPMHVHKHLLNLI